MGGGQWEVSPEAALSLRLPPVENYSGDAPYENLLLYAVSQEVDGSQSRSADWPFSIDVYPVIDGDGITNWNLENSLTEGEIESGVDVSLGNAGSFSFVDGDGSESVESFRFDLNSVISNAQIKERLKKLTNQDDVDVDDLIGYIGGDNIYEDNGNGTITVPYGLIGGLWMSWELFWDSNVDFNINVTALLRDYAVIDGKTEEVFAEQAGSFSVKIAGTADTPVAFASDVTGPAGTPLLMNFGGNITDTDEDLNRDISESIHFFVTLKDYEGNMDEFSFIDDGGQAVGIDAGAGSWYFTQEDLNQSKCDPLLAILLLYLMFPACTW